ncbi:MAG TPA: carbohydrate binding domain-containing protein, partial [Chryseosolibacter sp.]|nr:carbohydrate binding domain-containing protein [Chryseosolibacter sp.]
MEVYRRSINGTFDDKLGGWNVKRIKAVNASVAVDTTGQLTGKNAVKVTMLTPAENPNALALTWNLKAEQGQEYLVRLNSKANKNTSFLLRVGRPDGGGSDLIDSEIAARQTYAQASSDSFTIPQDGTYQIALYFGTLKAGDELWIDDVELVPLKNN